MTPEAVHAKGWRTPRGHTHCQGTSQKEWTPAYADAGEGARDSHGHLDGTRDVRDSWVLIPALDGGWHQS